MVAKEDYGTVVITEGEYAGHVGYYDDDVSDTVALVYIGMALFEKGVEIPREYLVTEEKVVLLSLHRLLRKHPEVEDTFGIVVRRGAQC